MYCSLQLIKESMNYISTKPTLFSCKTFVTYDCLFAWQYYSCGWPFYPMITKIEWSSRCSLIRSINDWNARLESAKYFSLPDPRFISTDALRKFCSCASMQCHVFHVTKSILYLCGYLTPKIKSPFDVLDKDEWQSDRWKICMNVINTIKIMYPFCFFRPNFQGSPSWAFLRKVVNPFWVI